MSWLNDFVSLIYPHQCVSCSKTLYDSKNCICIRCQIELPKTSFHLEKDNAVEKIFWGRARISLGMSYYYLSKKSKVEQLLYALKYQNNEQLGVEIGQLYGADLKDLSKANHFDCIVPVPLHPNKLKSRGYNQSHAFATGLSNKLVIPCVSNVLIRNSNTSTQTKKNQYERWLNVDNVFSVTNASALTHKHILLVDDVVTTGATLDSCAQVLLDIEGTKVSIATIAYAQ